MKDILFKNAGHEDRYFEFIDEYVKNKKPRIDRNHHVLFYLIALNEDLYRNRKMIFSMDEDCIRLDSLNAEFHTSESYRALCLAFNLFSGYVDEGHPADFSPYHIFVYNNPYYIEAIRIFMIQ